MKPGHEHYTNFFDRNAIKTHLDAVIRSTTRKTPKNLALT